MGFCSQLKCFYHISVCADIDYWKTSSRRFYVVDKADFDSRTAEAQQRRQEQRKRRHIDYDIELAEKIDKVDKMEYKKHVAHKYTCEMLFLESEFYCAQKLTCDCIDRVHMVSMLNQIYSYGSYHTYWLSHDHTIWLSWLASILWPSIL